jgi:DNA processing protein
MHVRELLRRGFSEPQAAARLDRAKLEMGAYEALWLRPGATFKTVAEWMAAAEEGRASALVDDEEAERSAREVLRVFAEAGLRDARVKLAGEPGFPARLGDARHPLQAFYYRGDLSLLNMPAVAVVGARQLSTQGAARTRRLVRHLVEDGFTIVSGLAAGTDAVAHATALEMGGRTIAVLGTPIHRVYPRQNAGLQAIIA